jgi:hypothetical protein
MTNAATQKQRCEDTMSDLIIELANLQAPNARFDSIVLMFFWGVCSLHHVR